MLCSPGAATASTASYDTCPAALPDGGTRPFATRSSRSSSAPGLVLAGTSSVRVHGLDEADAAYDIAVVAVGLDGTPSAPSAAVQGTPGESYGLADLYHQDGGTAQGCSVGGVAATTGWGAIVALAVGLVLALARRRRSRAGSFFVALVVAGFVARPALAQMGADGPSLLASADATPSAASSRWWNLTRAALRTLSARRRQRVRDARLPGAALRTALRLVAAPHDAASRWIASSFLAAAPGRWGSASATPTPRARRSRPT